MVIFLQNRHPIHENQPCSVYYEFKIWIQSQPSWTSYKASVSILGKISMLNNIIKISSPICCLDFCWKCFHRSPQMPCGCYPQWQISQIAKFMGPTWGPPGSCRPQMGPMLAPWTLLSGMLLGIHITRIYGSKTNLALPSKTLIKNL